MKLNDLVIRRYTESGKDVYGMFKWKKVDVKIVNNINKETILDMKDLEFPEHFSQSACDIIASKFLRKGGLGTSGGKLGYESSYKQLVDRMVNFWVLSTLDAKLLTKEESVIFSDELKYMLVDQMWAPNSPQWFNTGLKHAYGIKGNKQGHYYYDKKLGKVVESKDSYTRTQGSACFIVGVEDSLVGKKSITDQLETETRLFKYGSGVGTNWSTIRAEGELLSGGGVSSGLMSFLKVFDRNAGAIKSGGTTRRAAKMNVLDASHPEIMEFIRWKSTEEQKVRDLGKMGYDTDFNGEAYETVSGQNVNNSIRLSDEFMESVKNDGYTELVEVTTGKVVKKVRAKKVWDELAKATWQCGDPGVQFDDTINKWHTTPAGEDGNIGAKHNRINASNPCSEYMFLDDTACNLASINLMRFYDVLTDKFDVEGYKHCITFVQLVLESTIHWGQFPTEDIARKSWKFRTTGLGFANLGALIMSKGLPYDSDDARCLAGNLMSTITGQSYLVSSLMAKRIGAFDAYELNKDSLMGVLERHLENSNNMMLDYDGTDVNMELLNEETHDLWARTLKLVADNGVRNAQVSVLAPTGTISFAMDCETTSSEPYFSHITYKKLVGGSYMKMVNNIIPVALKKLGYDDTQIENIVKYVEDNDRIEGAPGLKLDDYLVFDTANKNSGGERFIKPEGHVRMMASLTKHVSGAISKTVNMPNNATVDDISNVYMLAYDLGVKAIAIYRDGCKASQPLNISMGDNEGKKELEDMNYSELIDEVKKVKGDREVKRLKPTGIRNASVHEAEMAGTKLYVTISYYENGDIGEVYVSAGRQGSLVKGLLDSISTTISVMIQYGISPSNISRMYRGQKFEPSGFVSGHPYIKMADSFSDLISKIIDIELGDYTYCQVKPKDDEEVANSLGRVKSGVIKEIKEERVYGEVCSSCGSDKLVVNGTCKVCKECGTTTGCS